MSSARDSLIVGVYAPLLGGFYFGELIGQIRQSCQIKGYELTVIDTRGLGQYQSDFATEHFDIVIILRNAIHVELVKRLQQMGKTVVSIAFDYFPLQVPVIGCDNEKGAEIACRHLYENGHRDLTFIGELAQFDVRKRYEAFSEFCVEHDLPVGEAHIIPVKNSLLSGGQKAADHMLKSDNASTGVVCGSCLTAVGFIRKLQHLNPERLERLQVVSFDAFSIIPFAASSVTTVDQNLHLIAYSAVSVAETLYRGGEVPHLTVVQPKLIEKEGDLMASESGYMATSIELDAFYDANYMKSLLVSMYEWPREIAASKLADLMMLEPLFVDYLQVAIFSKKVKSNDGSENLKILRALFAHYTPGQQEGLVGATVELPRFNSVVQTQEGLNFSRIVHIPIYNHNMLVAMLSVFGCEPAAKKRASFIGMCSYLNTVADALIHEIRDNDKPSAKEFASATRSAEEEGTIVWDRKELVATWDNTALAMLGLDSELERSIYRNMDIADRVREADNASVAALLQESEATGGRVYVRFRMKNKSYNTFELRCDQHLDARQSQYKIGHWVADV